MNSKPKERSLARSKNIAFGNLKNSDTPSPGPITMPMQWAISPIPWKPHAGQRKAVKFLLEQACVALLASPGTGKTSAVLAAFKVLLKRGLAKKMLVVAPLRPATLVWPPECKKWVDFKDLRIVVLHGKDKQKVLDAGDFDIAVTNYEGLPWLLGAKSIASFGGKRKSVSVDVKGFKSNNFDTLVMDECFVRGTPVLTPNGERPIEEIQVGDVVSTDIGPRCVLRTMCRKAVDLVELRLSNGTKITCTPEHPIYSGDDWVAAKSSVGKRVYSYTNYEVRRVSYVVSKAAGSNYSAVFKLWKAASVQRTLWGAAYVSRTTGQNVRHNAISARSNAFREGDYGCKGDTNFRLHGGEKDTAEMSKMRRASASKTKLRCMGLQAWHSAVLFARLLKQYVLPQEPQFCAAYGKRASQRVYLGKGTRTRTMRGAYALGASRLLSYAFFGEDSLAKTFTKLLHLGFRGLRENDGGGGGREKSSSAASARCAKGCEAEGTWVDSVTSVKQDSAQDVWNLSVDEAERYFAGGVLVHNCSRVKHTNTSTYKMLRQVAPTFARRWGLTGSPASNGLHDLFGQITMIDGGRSFGQYITHYRNQYFLPHPSGFGWKIREGADKEIYTRIRPVALRLDASDYVSMPLLVNRKLEFDLPADVRKLYTQVEDEMYAEIDAGKVVAANAAAVSSKCRQIVDGGVYLENEPDSDDDRRRWKNLHEERVEILSDLIAELQGEPILVAYEFKHSLDRLLLRFGKNVPYLGGGVSTKRAAEIEHEWNQGTIPLLLANPRAAGHGLNLQGAGAQICWHSLSFDLELYQQFIARVHRQGQKAKRVFVHHIIAKKTIDETIYWALQAKDKTQTALLDALKQRRR